MAKRDVQIHAAIAEAIKGRIARGEWLAGQRLPSIQQLALEYGVGTGSIREAARSLEAAGLLVIKHGRGVFVAEQAGAGGDAGVGSILALLEARRILEPELAALAAERASEQDRRSITELATEMARLVMAGADVTEFCEPDVLFHQCIARASMNDVLANMMDGVNDLLLESRKVSAQASGMNQRAARYHMLIAEAIGEGNALQARVLMLAHVNDAIDAVLAIGGEAASHTRAREAGAPSTSTVLLAQRTLPVPGSGGI